MDPKDMEINALNDKIVDQQQTINQLIAGLYAITTVAGNLADRRIMEISGINDGKSHAIMVVNARDIAVDTLNKAGFEAGIKVDI